MSLYQVSVLKKHLNLQDQDKLTKAYKKYTKYFLNPTIQDNIRSSKEEEYQGIFLTELFVNILDYTLKPKADFNLVAEYKNQTNSRKADGAILNNEIAIGVIELKGTNTKDLESIRKQAFDYKVNQKGCVYVITSNFEKLRFYINDATEFEEFNLFELTEDRFALLYLCLQKDNIINDTPLQIKKASLVVEEQITKQFYKDYSLFKRELYRNLVKRNAKRLKNGQNNTIQSDSLDEDAKAEITRLEKNVKLSLFKKSQKLIDRFLFIFFVEDRGLLPPNSTIQILEKWKADIDFGDERPLYDLFKQYFRFLDKGRQGTSSRAEIYAYNGGLFKEDNLLDNLEIDNDLLYKHTYKLAVYDFESQVDVNILGHIFENSLNEIESVNAEIEGDDFDKQKSKRKKDGVFYTPKYITKYIVENTVGKLCEEKKTELGFKEEEYFKGRKKRNKSTIEKLVGILDSYRDWLLQLTICDPACGSGAFLNQALDFLIKEHNYIDELKTKVLGGGFQFPDIENTILENNIYGVDLNDESVEIAKLSLWLRTAQPRRKLNNLSSNIKCGNSIIDNKAVAGDKAFNWQEQFPKIFAKGGFDIVIGNPPYVQSHSMNEITKKFIYKNYATSEYQINLYTIFIEKILQLCNSNSLYSVIIPNYWISTKYDEKFRSLVFLENTCTEILNTYEVFEDVIVDTVILTGIKDSIEVFPKSTIVKSISSTLKTHKDRWIAIDNKDFKVNKTVLFESKKDSTLVSFQVEIALNSKIKLKDLISFKKGMQPYEKGKGIPHQTREMMDAKIYHSDKKIDETYKLLLKATNIQRYLIRGNSGYIKYGENLAAKRNVSIFRGQRILMNRILSSDKIDAAFIEEDDIINNSDVFNLLPLKEDINMKAILSLISSKLCASFFRSQNINLNRKAFPKLNVGTLERFPVPEKFFQIQNIFSDKVEICGLYRMELFENKLKMENYIKDTYHLEKFSRKLESWHDLEFGDFIKELDKVIKANNKLLITEGKEAIPILSKKDEYQWLDLFKENKHIVQKLQTQINKIDKEIDAMVYELYELTEDEITIVENS